MWFELAIVILVVVALVLFANERPPPRNSWWRESATAAPSTSRPSATSAPASSPTPSSSPAPESPDARQLLGAGGRYRIWTHGRRGNQEGRFYLASYGISRADAQLITQNEGVPASVVGGLMFLFKPNTSTLSLTDAPALYLNPLGNEPYLSLDDRFRLDSSGSGFLMRAGPNFNNELIAPCYAANCVPGVLLFGGDTGMAVFQARQSGSGYLITRETAGGLEYLNVGRPMCPPERLPNNATPDQIAANAFIQSRCNTLPPGVVGGPSLALMEMSPDANTGMGGNGQTIFYFESA